MHVTPNFAGKLNTIKQLPQRYEAVITRKEDYFKCS